jgi:hypothetical protein
MFQLLQEDLEDCIEILKRIASESGTERTLLISELYMTERKEDVKKVVDLCEQMMYYYERSKLD